MASKSEGKSEGKAESILRVLAARQIDVTETDRQRIMSEQDLALLDTWLDRSLTARSSTELF